MNHSTQEPALRPSPIISKKIENWSEAHIKGEKYTEEIYAKSSEQKLKELEVVREMSREMQNNLNGIETSLRIAEVENREMYPTAPLINCSAEHEFMSNTNNCYAEEDKTEAKEFQKRKLTKGNGPKTEIQQFYTGKCIFLTGGTGFLGKVTIEKLLRSCGDFDSIYVLIRNKKGKDPVTRLHELLDQEVFQKAHEANPKGIHKIIPVAGDVGLPGLGLSDEDRKTLISKVNIIINSAATVRFDEKLRVATLINVSGTKQIIDLAKECKNLVALTHVSTAYSNCHYKHIEEKFYETHATAESLEAINELDDAILDTVSHKIVGRYPNTYCFTKAVAEDTVRVRAEGLPVCIVRPSIIISAYEEPIRGWTDSVYGPTGIIIGIGTGVLRTMYMKLDNVADMIPVDLTVNAILAATWNTAKEFKENQTSEIPIYNFVSSAQNPMRWDRFIELNRSLNINKPSMKCVWYYGFNPTKSYSLFLFYNFFLHYLPALLIDSVCAVTGRKQQMLNFYYKVMKLANILFYFSMNEWKFENGHVQKLWQTISDDDKAIFNFNIADMSWEYYVETFLFGLRVYLIKDDLSTIPEAKKKWVKLYIMHMTLKTITFAILMFLAYFVLKSMFKIFIP